MRRRSISNESFDDPKEAIRRAKLDRFRREYKMNFKMNVPSIYWNDLSWIQSRLFGNEEDTEEKNNVEDLESLRERYKKKFNKNVAIRHSNSVDWILEKLAEDSESAS